MSIKLEKEFKGFYKKIKLDESNDMIEKRNVLERNFKSEFPKILTSKGIDDIKINKFIDQGSYKINTTIKPKDNVYDRDVAVILNMDSNKYDPVEVKRMVRDALYIAKKRVPMIKEPCVTIEYMKDGEEKFHIDFPIYANNSGGSLVLARGREFSDKKYRSWESSDPEGLNNYFINRLKGDDGKQLKRVIRYLKKWKSERYFGETNDRKIPPSIALTLIACQEFSPQKTDDKYDDLKALSHVVNKLISRFAIVKDAKLNISEADIYCFLPVKPNTDVFSKMKEGIGNPHIITFFNKASKLKLALDNAIKSDFDSEAAEYIAKELGSEFDIPSSNETSKKSDFVSIKGEDSFA